MAFDDMSKVGKCDRDELESPALEHPSTHKAYGVKSCLRPKVFSKLEACHVDTKLLAKCFEELLGVSACKAEIFGKPGLYV